MQDFPSDVRDWLKQRGLTDKVISQLKWDGYRIGIPIKTVGKVMKHKWRRHPYTPRPNEPKYVADTGLSRTLFLSHLLPKGEKVFIIESEMDALLLYGLGHIAVSSTTGAGNYDPAWLPLFRGKEIIIWYDEDQAGRAGANKLGNALLPFAKSVKIVSVRNDGYCGSAKDCSEQLAVQFLLEDERNVEKFLAEHCDLVDPKPEPPKEMPVYRPSAEREPPEKIETTLTRHNLKLKKVGSTYFISCPRHSDSTPSLSVKLDRQVWFCHACGVGGGANDFKRLFEN